MVTARTVAPFSDKPGSQNRTAKLRKKGIWEIARSDRANQTGRGACSASASDRDGGTTNL
ncbi:hypothetical protein GCM10011576_20810 [Micromonospora parathelypteridis]|nr:hypothetical protein GCM10011576_20810 [Micromonospora parathelypteridis]